jgi:hypothetical protein
MPMTENFSNAASRSWRDANFLLQDARLATADHLFGVSAECALKAVMVALSGTKLSHRYKIHLPKLWDEFIAYVPSSGTNAYASLLAANPFKSWDVSDRYGHDTAFTQTRVDSHRDAALQAQRVLEQARLDGRLI